jgi:perosamine synthetase
MLIRSKKKIAFAGPWITEKEEEYVLDATVNGFYENFDGYAKRLEATVADYVGAKYSIATHCCTHALHLACAALDLGPGDEVICTDFSWVATAYAIKYTGAEPVFVDIDPETWTIDPAAIERAVTPKSKAIMIVHSFGIPADMTAINHIAKKYNLKVIEDAAPALGSEHNGERVGALGDIGCFSFQGAKLTVSGEGGIFLTNDEKVYEKACLLASMGRTNSKANFWSDYLGYQYTIANLTAALALAQVERVDELIERKRQIFSWYDDRIGSVEGISLIREPKGSFSNYCYPSLMLGDSIDVQRDKVLEDFAEMNIHCRPGFPRMSQFPVHEARFENPVSESVEKRGISLASAGNLTELDVDFVCEVLLQSLGRSNL